MRTDPKGSDDMGRVLRHAVLGYSHAMGLSKARDNLMTRKVCPVACGLVTWEFTLHNKIRLSTPVAARTGTGRLEAAGSPGGFFLCMPVTSNADYSSVRHISLLS
jgi:hypothetical protein